MAKLKANRKVVNGELPETVQEINEQTAFIPQNLRRYKVKEK